MFARLPPPPAAPGAAGAPPSALSADLRARLEQQRDAEAGRLQAVHRGRLVPGVPFALPAARMLRAYAFDPSLETKLEL